MIYINQHLLIYIYLKGIKVENLILADDGWGRVIVYFIYLQFTEGVKLSGIETSAGRISGETNKWRRRGKFRIGNNLSGKRTEQIHVL